MKFKTLHPILWTEKFDESVGFYTSVLGFTCVEKNEDWGWASLQKDEVLLMLSKPNAHARFEKAVFTGSFYINTDNVDELWNRISGKATVVYPPETFEWGMKEFAIYDINGYILQFGQPLQDSTD